jgi:ATP-dependent DNA helicase PIF1
MRQKHSKSPDAVAITASTGMAACNIGGVTIHSFAGIGLGIETAEQLATKVRKNRKAVGRWLRTKVLIIDEGQPATKRPAHLSDPFLVSMVEADLFDKLCKLGGILHKKPNVPFGGIQVRGADNCARRELTQ